MKIIVVKGKKIRVFDNWPLITGWPLNTEPRNARSTVYWSFPRMTHRASFEGYSFADVVLLPLCLLISTSSAECVWTFESLYSKLNKAYEWIEKSYAKRKRGEQ